MPKKVMKIEMDPSELMVRLTETAVGMKRREGLTTNEAVADIISADPDMAVAMKTMADVAFDYFAEVLKKHGTLHQVN